MCSNIEIAEIENVKEQFKKDRFVYIRNFIRNNEELLEEIQSLENKYKRRNSNSLIDIIGQLNVTNNTKNDNIIKQHYVISGTDIQKQLPNLHYNYHNCFGDIVSKIVGTKVYPINEKNTTNNSLFIYEKEGDSLRWHTDGSMFNGKRVFTLLIYLYNDSTQNLCYINSDDKKKCIHTDTNSAVILEHFNLEHAVTPMKRNEKKILWTMTFAEDMNINGPMSYIADKTKNFSYLGLDTFTNLEKFFLVLITVLILYLILKPVIYTIFSDKNKIFKNIIKLKRILI